MNFAFTEEQGLIRDTVAAFAADWRAGGGLRRAAQAGGDRAAYLSLAQELGLAGIAVPEALGGAGLGAVERALVMEELGKVCFAGPFFSSAVLATDLLLAVDDQKILPRLAAGETVASASLDPVSFTQEGDGYRLTGSLRAITDADCVDTVLVPAWNGERSALFAIEANALSADAVLDVTRPLGKADLDLAVSKDALIAADIADALPRALSQSAIALAAESVGVAQTALDMTVAYTKERVQFGRTIASFQAVKHRCADMMIATESARSAVYYAAALAHTGEAAEAAAIAKSWCTQKAFTVTGDAIQMHGGIGFTWDYDLHFFFKRARANRTLLGLPSDHLEDLASLILDEEAA